MQHIVSMELVFHARMKHIEVHYHFIRERVLVDGDIDLTYVRTDE